MQVILSVRQEQLDVIKTAIEAGSMVIVFKEGATVLAEMQFKELIDIAGDAKYVFKAFDDTTSLKATVIQSGRVEEFSIDGEEPPGGGPVVGILTGSVGALNSNSDIRFNRRDWSETGVVTLNNLTLILLQGQT